MNEEKIYYENKYKIKLCGVLNKLNKNDLIVVICHGGGSHKDSRATKYLSEYLNENNINNFRFDYTSCGESEGDSTDLTINKLIDDLESSLDYLQNKGFKRFILFGYSMGGRLCVLLDKKKYNIEKLVLWSPAIEHRYPLEILKRKLFKGKKEKEALKNGFYDLHGQHLNSTYFKEERLLNPFKDACKIDIPILIIHGSKDQFVNYNNSKKIAKRNKNVELIIIPNENHGFKIDDNNLKYACDKSIEFITK